MKRLVLIVCGVFVAAGSALAQPPPSGQQLTLSASLNRGYNAVKLNLTEEAAKMGESDYGFKPGSAAELRTYGQLFGHVANAQYGSRAALLANVVAHSNEMYGTGAVYMRAKGMVPPSTERAAAAQAGRGAPRQ